VKGVVGLDAGPLLVAAVLDAVSTGDAPPAGVVRLDAALAFNARKAMAVESAVV
jgi:hypothetical protein